MMYEFYGEKICCGTYAFLNLVQNQEIEEDWFELSLSVPFGIVHKRYPRYDHLLTPYCDPNQGMDEAVRLWGYGVTRMDFTDSDEFIAYLKNRQMTGRSVLVGPVDMGKLYYQPLTYLYRRLDHFIVVTVLDQTYLEITDSEGILWERCSFDQLRDMISVQDIVEAEGKITVRTIWKEKEIDTGSVMKASYVRACENMRKCQEIPDGQNAFEKCCEYLENIEYRRWGIALLYDISYLMQRKILCGKLFRRVIGNGDVDDWKGEECVKIVEEQLKLLRDMFESVRTRKLLGRGECVTMDSYERKLSETMRCKCILSC